MMKTPDELKAEIATVGITPETPVDNVKAVVEYVHTASAR